MTNFFQSDHGLLQVNAGDLAGTLGLSAFAGTQTNGFTLTIVSGVATWAASSATNATNLSGGVAGAVPYQSAVGTTLFTAAGSSGQTLISGGTGSPTWTSSPTFTAPALGTPASGTLTNCTFPTLNQNTSGSSASCTGNSATATSATSATTATNQSGGTVSATTGSFSGVLSPATFIRRTATTGYLDGFYGTVEGSTTGGIIYSIGGGLYYGTGTGSTPLIGGSSGGMYGIGYTTSSTVQGSGTTTIATATGAAAGSWGLYVASGGVVPIFLDSDHGSIYATGSINGGTLNATSDRNLKTNIKTITDGPEIIASLNGVRFDWKKDGMPSAGLIAQDVEALMPELVTTAENGNKSLNYNGITGVLVEAVKSLMGEVESLKATIELMQRK